MKNDLEDVVEELRSLAGAHAGRARRPARRAMSVAMKAFVIGAVLITLASMALAAVVLFTQTPTYTSGAMLYSGCTAPTGTASGTLITFACPTGAPITVSSTASGFVTYTGFTVPSNVTDVYLIDTLATPATTCTLWTSVGDQNLVLQVAGGSFTVGTSAGRIQPGHAYNYCADFSSAPPTFSFTITWSQG